MSVQKTIFSSGIFNTVCAGIGFLSFSAVSFFMAVFLTALTYFWINDRPTIYETTFAPDGKLKAVVFGEAKSGSRSVSVLSSKANIEKNSNGNLFSQTCSWAGVRWIDNHRLRISVIGSSVTSEKTSSFVAFDRDLQIEYQYLKGD